ncbi:MAG TPA: 4-hydroxythreonine-4-phosphate dehydrogenase PdxA [Hyphomicrobiaceae bacterium]|nr:4-hydroxythreonine-4-phosphate dehydrogenase PdxA [Hyphomicrobiaceae bacterium]
MAASQVVTGKPAIALAMGDPSGISLELLAKILTDKDVRAAANFIVVGDARALAEGNRIAGTRVELPLWQRGNAEPDFATGAVLLDLGHLDPATLTTGESSEAGGAFALRNFRTALNLGRDGLAEAVTFTPFNKHAMRLSYPKYIDEIEIITDELGGGPGREFNVLPNIWNARITSHVPLSGVSKLITRKAVLEGLMLTDRCMREAGYARPRIAVAALNPHAGDGGNFGHEDDDEITPGIADAKARGIVCDGPFPSDTVFLRAKRGDFDAVQTMYHDQGQIAMKLIGFDEGVTLIGGYRVPVCTPAHGTAYDIAGKGIANIGASKAAMLLAARLAVEARIRNGRAA